MRPELLDLYCCEGGASEGYRQAGFDVYGLDIDANRLRRYPFPSRKGDALAALRRLLYGLSIHFTRYGSSTWLNATDFDVVAASPPCQRFTHGNAGSTAADKWPDLIGPTRDLLIELGKPYIIENVPRAPLNNPVTLCGTMFDLTATDDDDTVLHLRRHRLFESNVFLYPPRPCNHPDGVQWAGVYGGARRDKTEAREVRKGGYVPPNRFVQGELLGGVDWMSERGMQESIPPRYTEWLGGQLIEHLKRTAA